MTTQVQGWVQNGWHVAKAATSPVEVTVSKVSRYQQLVARLQTAAQRSFDISYARVVQRFTRETGRRPLHAFRYRDGFAAF